MQFTSGLNGIGVPRFWEYREGYFVGLVAAITARAFGEETTLRCAENEQNERTTANRGSRTVTAQAAIMARSSSNWAGRRSTRPIWTAPIPSWWL